jgi:hypothetical protein
MGNRPVVQKFFSDFDKVFGICRALDSKHFHKKIFFQSFCFHREKLKILPGEAKVLRHTTKINLFQQRTKH